MNEFSYYTFSHRYFFDTLDSYSIQDDHSAILRELIPENWKLTRFEHWLQASHDDQKPLDLQGFKIHVSSAWSHAEETLRRVVPICVESDTCFKIVADSALLRFANSKRFGRGGSGKFIVIYPHDTESFIELIDAIAEATKGLEGPYILSDKRFKDSKVVFYRYGGFQRLFDLQIDGTRRSMIRNPNGELIEDRRLPYFELPFEMDDPFPDVSTEDEEDDGLLAGRYQVEDAFAYTNTGGVYRAKDHKTGETVVIKEARPHTETWLGRETTVDAITALRKEHNALEKLAGLQCVPEAIDLFEEWEHTFLVTSFFPGDSLAELRATTDFIVMVNMDDPERVAQFCVQWKRLTLHLFEALDAVHARGLIVGDVSPTNVLYDQERDEICLIDFEGAFIPDHDHDSATFSVQWFNPGFRAPDRRQNTFLEPVDDYYAMGMLLYSMIIPSQSLYELDPQQPIFRFLDYFVEAGLPREVRDIIDALLTGNDAEARQIVDCWEIA